MKIKAAVVKEAGAPYEIKEIELQEPKGKDVLVKMVASGLCRSDYGERNGNSIKFPNVLGHEGAGIIESVGEGVTDFKPGDHVLLSYGYCKHCEHCDGGHPASCSDWLKINNSGTNARGEYVLKDGDVDVNNFFNQSSFATYSLTDESNLVKVDKSMDLRMVGPLSCGIGTGSGAVFDVLQPKPGSSIAVFGTGAVGFAAIMASKIAGCSQIIAIDINEDRLKDALRYGATTVINGMNTDAADEILKITDQKGVNYTIDTTGNNKVMNQALQVTKSGGTFIPLAVTKNNFEVNTFFDLVFGNKEIKGVLLGNTIPKYHLPRLIDYYQKGQFPFDEFIEYFDFEDINKAEEASISGRVIKPVVIMDKEYRPEVA